MYYYLSKFGYSKETSEKSWDLEFYLPGYSKKDVSLGIIDARRKLSIKTNDEKCEYSFDIPLLYDLSKIDAKLKFGKLVVSIPADEKMFSIKTIELT